MVGFFTQFVNTMLNIILFSLIPFGVYLIRKRKPKSFFYYLGLYLPSKAWDWKSAIGWTSIVYLGILVGNVFLWRSGYSARTADGLENLSVFSLLIELVLYGLRTGVAEEVFFRGFIAKELISHLGYKWGNFLQALIFALPHVVVEGPASFPDLISRIGFAFVLGYMFGWVMEKKAQGSVLPGMAAHFLINSLSSFCLLLVLGGF